MSLRRQLLLLGAAAIAAVLLLGVQQQRLLLAALPLGLLLLLLALIGLRVLRPLGRLQALLQQDASLRGGDEIAKLAVAFDARISALSQALAQQTSQRLQTEEELARLKAKLQAVDGARTARGELLATVSHEIRTPMNGLIGMIELVQRTALNSQQRDYVDSAQVSAQRLQRLVGDILDYARLDAGPCELEPAVFDLCATLHEGLQPFADEARKKGLQLSLQLAPGLPAKLLGDARRLVQLVEHLVGNALKFTSRGEVVVSVVADGSHATAAALLIQVADTGIGIASRDHARVFEAFTQVDGSSTRRFGGAGLGLAICRRLVSAMGGLIWLESTPGSGSRFFVRLSFELPPLGQPAPVPLRRAPAVATSLQVLIAEDNAVNRRFAAEVLGARGHRVIAVDNGEEAVKTVGIQPFDLILMDLDMPVMDGLIATRLIRAREAGSGRHSRIVALTAHVTAQHRQDCLAVGMDGYLAKPYSADALIALAEPNTVAAADVAKPVPPPRPAVAGHPFERIVELARRSQQPGIVVELIDSFQASLPKIYEDLQRAIDSENAVALIAAAHHAKGAAANFNAAPAIDAALQLEIRASEGRLSKDPALLQPLRSAFDTLSGELRQMRAEYAAAA